ncbi:hypothetical protein WJX73_004732 [Symbiochloris irregularis]|uniref:Vacuolar protein sorting-associated protein 51 homolog n=1 Tax=Symbiochloris irregularis TaxID=706552 RepID=A0AAW1PCF8_9CHLO
MAAAEQRMGGAMADVKAQRVRDLLSSYYGNNDDAASDTPETPSETSRAPSKHTAGGLDSLNFDADRYLSQLLRQARLKALMQKHIEMSMEIKTLDSDMQNLVYENYNKFISATDTIRAMKSNVGNMDTSMASLKEMIESVADRSGAVNAKLQTRRDHIEELSQVRSLLQKLQAVFELPKQLKVAIDAGALEVAVNSYADAAPLLKRYGHKGAFRKVAAESGECAKRLTALLRQRLVQNNDEAAECIQMVRKLGGPIESLQEDFLHCMQKRMTGILDTAAGIMPAVLASESTSATATAEARQKAEASWGVAKDQTLTLHQYAVQLDQRFLSELSQTGALFSELFGSSGRAQLVKVTRSAFSEYLKLLRSVLEGAATGYARSSAGALSGSRNTGNVEAPKDWGAGAVAEALHTISTDVPRIHSILPELSASDRGTELVEKVVRHHISACFGSLESSAVALVEAAGAKLSEGAGRETSAQPLAQAHTEITTVLARGLKAVVRALKGYQQRQWSLLSWQDVFVDRLQGQLQHMLLSLLSRFLQLTGTAVQAGSELAKALPDAGTSTVDTQDASTSGRGSGEGADVVSQPPGVLLLLARVCTFLETEAVVQVMETLASTFPGQGGGSGGDQPPAFVAGTVARVAGATSSRLLDEYVAAQGARLSLTGGAAGAPSTAGGGGAASVSTTQSYASPSGNAMERNVARLFTDHVSLFGEVQFTAASILAAVTCAGLKAFVEMVRLQTLNRAGMQQLQLDVHYLRPFLRRHASGAEGAAIHHLLDEVVAAAVERSTEPQLLDAALMDKILASAKRSPADMIDMT